MITQLKEETEKLLNHEIFHFNKTRVNYNYFPTYLKSLFEEYDSVINNKEFWKAFCSVHYPNNPETADVFHIYTGMISELSRKILLAVEAYYLGMVNVAYNHLKEGLNEKITYSTSKLFENAILHYDEGKFCAYRIRRSVPDSFDNIGLGQMFHIPFQMRHKVSTQRFSIPGYPSLYLGDSIFVCWKELNEPKINEIYASRFSNKFGVNVIEILSVSELKSILNKVDSPTLFSSEIFKYILTFPLNIACSIKTKNHLANFKCEYIIPQLFLQFVMEHKTEIDGIKYYSTRVDPDRIENVPFNNFIFPTKTNNTQGYCSLLTGKFNLTEPVLWEHEEINQGNVTYYGHQPRRDVNIELIKGRKIPYDHTTFKAIEDTLSFGSLELQSITN